MIERLRDLENGARPRRGSFLLSAAPTSEPLFEANHATLGFWPTPLDTPTSFFLWIHVDRVKKLVFRNREKVGDPYVKCTVEVPGQAPLVDKTATKSNRTSATYNRDFMFELEGIGRQQFEGSSITLTIYDDNFMRDQPIGHFRVDFSTLRNWLIATTRTNETTKRQLRKDLGLSDDRSEWVQDPESRKIFLDIERELDGEMVLINNEWVALTNADPQAEDVVAGYMEFSVSLVTPDKVDVVTQSLCRDVSSLDRLWKTPDSTNPTPKFGVHDRVEVSLASVWVPAEILGMHRRGVSVPSYHVRLERKDMKVMIKVPEANLRMVTPLPSVLTELYSEHIDNLSETFGVKPELILPSTLNPTGPQSHVVVPGSKGITRPDEIWVAAIGIFQAEDLPNMNTDFGSVIGVDPFVRMRFNGFNAETRPVEAERNKLSKKQARGLFCNKRFDASFGLWVQAPIVKSPIRQKGFGGDDYVVPLGPDGSGPILEERHVLNRIIEVNLFDADFLSSPDPIAPIGPFDFDQMWAPKDKSKPPLEMYSETQKAFWVNLYGEARSADNIAFVYPAADKADEHLVTGANFRGGGLLSGLLESGRGTGQREPVSVRALQTSTPLSKIAALFISGPVPRTRAHGCLQIPDSGRVVDARGHGKRKISEDHAPRNEIRH